MLLQGEALPAFEAQVSNVGNLYIKITGSIRDALVAVTNTVFPKQVTQVQKGILDVFFENSMIL